MGDFEAIAWERITVPAGSFRALRIRHTGWGYSLQYWYAPEVRYFVRFENLSGDEAGRVLELVGMKDHAPQGD